MPNQNIVSWNVKIIICSTLFFLGILLNHPGCYICLISEHN